VITVYAGAAFVILELVDILSPSLGLPQWTLNLVLILLIVGFFITVIVSWIYDIQPEGGIVKTVPITSVSEEIAPPSSKGWRIASYISFVVIVALIILNIIPRASNKKEIMEKSIAVLPFINDSPDEENTFFINGIMEEVLLNLQAIKDFKVPGRTSVEQYRDQSKSVPEIAEELNVNYIVEGSGQRYGNTVRLRIQLLESMNGTHLWGDSFELVIQSPEDIFRIQIRIAESIAEELEAIITPEEKQLIEKIPTTSLTALDFYLQGEDKLFQYWQDISNKAALEEAGMFYHKALDYDSTYAQAYVGLGSVYWNKQGWIEYLTEDYMDSVLIFSEKALSFDNTLAKAYYQRGRYYTETNRPSDALREFDKVLELSPNDANAYRGRAVAYWEDDFVQVLSNMHKAAELTHGPQLPLDLVTIVDTYGRIGIIEKAEYYLKQAQELFGDSLYYHGMLSQIWFHNGNYEKAIKHILRADKMNSNIPDIGLILARIYWRLGDYNKSEDHYNEYLEPTGALPPDQYHRLAYVYLQNGNQQKAQSFFDKQIEVCLAVEAQRREWSRLKYSYYDLAGVYAFRGEKDKAYQNLRIFNQKKTMSKWIVVWIKEDPMFDSIRNEPEFQQIVRDVEAKYQAEHERVRQWLEENDML